jgi:branched-chain amino acid transport system ATP-binding protein
MFPILGQFAHRRAGSLSGGQQQMLLLAQALSLRPSVLILDEPSAGLAPAIVDDLFAALRRLADLGLGVLLVEQLLDKSVAIADRAQVLELGSVIGAWQSPSSALNEVRESLRLTRA